MKSNDRPELIQRLGQSLYAYNYNIQEIDDGFECEQLLFDHIPIYEDVVNRIISEKYSNGAEMAIQRKGILDKANEEFVGYNNFVEDVKIKVKSEIGGEVIEDSDLAEQ